MPTEPPHIVLDPKILAGKPTIRGTRLSVEFINSLLASGWTEAEIVANCPGIASEDIAACRKYTSDMA